MQSIRHKIKPWLLWNTARESSILTYKEKCRISCKKTFNTFLKDGNSNMLIQSKTVQLKSAAIQTNPKIKLKPVKKHSIIGCKEFAQPIVNELKFLRTVPSASEIE